MISNKKIVIKKRGSNLKDEKNPRDEIEKAY